MGGHSAWRKRVKNGENAKMMAGAISRHRPHFVDGVREAVLMGTLHGGNKKKMNQVRPRSPTTAALGTTATIEHSTGSEPVLPFPMCYCLVASSFMIMAPAIMAHKAGLRALAGTYAMTSFVSANFWRCPCNGYRRDLDLVVANRQLAKLTQHVA